MDSVTKKKRSEIMSLIKSRDTKIEKLFRQAIWKQGLRYRKNPPQYFGKPDLVIKKHKTVIFIDSCFWHGCKKHCRMPKSRQEYWQEKIKRNIARGKVVTQYYKKEGWNIIRIWEHDLERNFDKCVMKTILHLRGKMDSPVQ